MTTHYDVIIVGAGPAGSACALSLKNSGLSVAILDKEKFPRNKTCGDAIPGPALKYLSQINPQSAEDFTLLKDKYQVTKSTMYTGKGRSLTLSWVLKAYNSKRSSFDGFLLNEVKKYTAFPVVDNARVKSVKQIDNHIQVQLLDDKANLTCKMIIGCDGANSIVAKDLLHPPHKKEHGSLAVRAYFKKVDMPALTNEFFLLKKMTGYFWIFQVNEEEYNVGYGVYRTPNTKHVNLKNDFKSIIANTPILQERLKNAEMSSSIKGFQLPLGGTRAKISGDHFLLCGDAASLIDPISGHGIDKAIKSGQLAAEQVMQCFDSNQFSSAFNEAYDNSVYKHFLPSLKQNLFLMRYGRYFTNILDLAFPLLNQKPDSFKRWYYKKKPKVNS